jgi:exopolyphosphatase/guanosine-5'-triphosphate,3'-diphosphate pyrophosphatase
MAVSKAAMREGVLYDMLGRGGEADPREASVRALMQRYGVEPVQAARVEATALKLFERVAKAWHFDADDRLRLSWAARLHELGLTIAHSQYHVHGAYILENSDIAGFSQQEQRFLATLVRTHRRKIPKGAFDALPDRLLPGARHCAALLRLAVLFHRSHEPDELPPLRLHAEGEQLTLTLPEAWLVARPLLRTDLETEKQELPSLGVKLVIETT